MLNLINTSLAEISQLVVMPVPLERSILTNVCPPELRGRANAILGIFDDLGKGLGPALVSILITTFDRQTAFNISLIGWIVGGTLGLAIMLVNFLADQFLPRYHVAHFFFSRGRSIKNLFCHSSLQRMRSLYSSNYDKRCRTM